MVNPQNPYQSYIVTASAGAGKTYQLSQRYLRLVAAGAHPGEILTVTFTKKAAAEMQERIFSDAMTLLIDESARQDFDAQIQTFFRDSKKQLTHIRPPRKAMETAELILTFSQQARIQTMDSLFQEMVALFPTEAGSHMPSPFALGNSFQLNKIYTDSFHKLMKIAHEKGGLLRENIRAILQKTGNTASNLRDTILNLEKDFLFFHALKKQGFIQQDEDLFLPPIDEFSDEADEELKAECMHIFKKMATALGGKTTQNALNLIPEFEASNDITTLRGGRALFPQKSWSVSAKNLEKIDAADLDYFLNLGYEIQRRQHNKLAAAYFHIFDFYHRLIELEKLEQHLISFDDITRGAFEIFHSEHAAGALYHLFLNTSHLLIDEFQDTSQIQWAIFRTIAEEFLSGQGIAAERGVHSTMFLVGDAKQSIYSFRNGDYTLLHNASAELQQLGASELSLNHSWRSSQLVLDCVNAAFGAPEFSHFLPDFAPHNTAELDGHAVVPDTGSFTLLTPYIYERRTMRIADVQAREAADIIHIIKNWILEKRPVYDKNSGQHRPIEWRDIGILYRSRTRSAEFENALIQRGVPYRIEERAGYFRRREIQDVEAFLHFLAQPDDDIAVATLLRSPFLRLPDRDLLQLIKHRKHKKDDEKSAESLFNALFVHHPNLHQKLSNCRNKVGSWSLTQILLHFFEVTDAYASYLTAFGPDEGRLAVVNLQHIIQIIGTQTPPGAASIRDYLRLLEQFRGVDETGNAPLSSNCITLMTMHKSKGLEFPVVILLGGESTFGDTRNDKSPFKKSMHHAPHYAYWGSQENEPPETEVFSSIKQKYIEEKKREDMRLFYVALTRAQEHVLVSSIGVSGTDNLHFMLKNTIFAEDLSDGHTLFGDISGWQIKRTPASISEPEVSKAKTDLKTEAPFLNFESIPEKGIKLVQPSTKSSAADDEELIQDVDVDLTTSLRDQEFYRLAGVLIHAGLAAHVSENSRWKLTNAFRQEVLNARFRYSEQEQEKLLDLVSAHLKTSTTCEDLKNLIKPEKTRCRVEVPVTHLAKNKLIRGVIDLLVITPEEIWIIDYKTISIKHKNPEAFIKDKGWTRQLRYYEKAVQVIYPNHTLNTAIFFTENGNLFPQQ